MARQPGQDFFGVRLWIPVCKLGSRVITRNYLKQKGLLEQLRPLEGSGGPSEPPVHCMAGEECDGAASGGYQKA